MPEALAKKMTRAQAADFFARLSEKTPTPETELQYKDPYTLLVAVALSAQATDVGVNKATAKLFPVADTPRKMVKLGVDGLGEYIRTIGLWRNKAKNVIALSQMLIVEYGGEVPTDREALERLPGVGRKTANVVCNVAFGQPTIAVDTHIFRVGNRTGLAPGKTPFDVERGLEKITPKEYLQHAHHWLILHGRYVCVARKPKCAECAVDDLCGFKEKTLGANLAPSARSAKKKPATKKAVKRKAAKAPTAKRAWAKLIAFALTYPEATEDHPWDHVAIKVRKKAFVFLSNHTPKGKDAPVFSLTVKLPISSEMAATLPFAAPSGYGLGRSGWITATFQERDTPPIDLLEEWIDQSYRAVAPKKLAASASPPVRGA